MRWIAMLGVTLIAGCAADTQDGDACLIEAPEPGLLDVDGTRLVDAQGRTITLRGINTGGRSKFAPYSPFEYEPGAFDTALADYLDRLEAWGFDVLRVPFSWEAVEPSEGLIDEEFLVRYDALLDGAHERGLWTIVDFHQDLYSEVYCGDGFPAWTLDDPPEPHHDCEAWFTGYALDDDVQQAFELLWTDVTGVRTAFAEMWDLMVDRHAGRPGVIGFEVINEPGWGHEDYDAWESGTLPDFYSEMGARIHARAPDALIFFDATGLDAISAETSLVRPQGDRLVFAPHFYDPTTFLGEGQLQMDVAASLQVWADLGRDWDVPVLVGEFGIEHEHPQAASHTRAHYDAFDAQGLHATWWEYSVSHELWNFENLSVVDGDGHERDEVLDELVRPYVRALAGTLTDGPRYDPDARTFEVRWEPAADGVTEIALPPRIFGDGAEVTAEGACYELGSDRVLVRAAEGIDEIHVVVSGP